MKSSLWLFLTEWKGFVAWFSESRGGIIGLEVIFYDATGEIFIRGGYLSTKSGRSDIVEFIFYPASDKGFYSIAEFMTASIQAK